MERSETKPTIMASVSPPETLNPSHESPNPSHEIQPSVPKPTDDNLTTTTTTDTSTGEKRKRGEDEEDEATPQPGPTPDTSLHPLYKTTLCSYFRRHSGSCSHGSTCRYAHGEEELRPRPDNTWDPTSKRAMKLAKLEENGADNNECKVKEEGEEQVEVMMTDIVADNGDGESEAGCLDPGLSKCLVHLPRKWSSDHLRKFLGDQGIIIKSAKKKKGMTVGFVSFENMEQVKCAIEELEEKSVGSKNIKVADVIPRPFEKKIKLAMALPRNDPQMMGSPMEGENAGSKPSNGDTDDGSSILDGSESSAKSARDVVTPLAHMDYEDQLVQKKNSVMQMLKKLTRNARKACPSGVSLPEWILKSREIGGLPCELEGILESPLRIGYRNKCEFSVGYSLLGKPTVGFMLGNFREGVTAVEEPVDCPNVSSIACKYALIFQDFLQQSSLPIWNRFKNTGFWRQLTVREGRLPGKADDVENPVDYICEVMLIVQVCSVGFDDELINSEFGRMTHAIVTRAAENISSLPLSALVIQDHRGISNVSPADAPLRVLPLPNVASDSKVEATNSIVEARIHDYISNLRFSISPTAFFQVNTLAAEKLYALAGDWAGLNHDTLLFDVCCGTGTIGLTLAHRVGMVVGIEMNKSAVSDAYRNAEINGIKNCRFVCAKAEDVMGPLLEEYLNLPQQQGEPPDASESDDKDNATVEEKETSKDNVLETNENSSHEIETREGASGCSQNVGLEIQSQPQKNCISEDGNSPLPQFKNVVAIVDPPRGGLHPIVIKALRTHSCLRQLVYISCNPETLVANAIELCTPSPDKVEKRIKNNRGWRKMSNAGLARHRAKSMPISEPFRPVKAMAIDLFPHTAHCEMVMLLER